MKITTSILNRPSLSLILFLTFGVMIAEANDPAVIDIPSRVAVGGGWSDAGPMGEYFTGNKLEGAAAFTRREVRVDFDWGTVLPIGGSTAEPYKSFPHDNFSARWTGKVIPRFSEPYIFTVNSDSKPTLSIKDSGTGKLTDIPLTKNADNKYVSQPIAFKNESPIELVLEYHHVTGTAYCSLRWSSPSTPAEVVDPVIEQGLNLASFSACWADQVKYRRWGNSEMADEKGQLKTNKGDYVFVEGASATPGCYLLSFTGYANISFFNFGGSKFIIDGKEYDKITAKGLGYDEKNNKTQATIKVLDLPPSNRFLNISDAFRDPAGTQPGLADFHVMRPMEKNSDTPCPTDAIAYPPMKRMASDFTCLRWLAIANGFGGCTGFWKDRTPPAFTGFTRGESKSQNTLNGGENWEYLIMFANESGRDLYLTTPVNADEEYFRKLAQLIRYGSDGMEPYTQPTANPKYPPLNSNLHLYFEVGNEIWNWGFPSSQFANKLAKDAVEQNTEEGKIINYDKRSNYRRYHAVRTVKASTAFREIFGDAAMNNRIRPLIEFQYANANATAGSSFGFIENYYNNEDGEHVKDPHPLRYYIWGGGGAAYYGVGNGEGEQNDVSFKDSSFEGSVIGDGVKASPPAGAWTFTGNAGVYRNLCSAVASYTPDKRVEQPKKTAVGMRFTTGEKPLWVYKLGRVYNYGNDKGARISVLKASDLSLIAKGETGPIQAYMTKVFGYYWAELPDKKPVQLEANTEYLLVSQDLGGSSQIAGFDSAIKPGSGLSNIKAVKVKMDDPENTKGWQVDNIEGNCCPGPITMLYSEKADVVVDLPQPPDGQQAAYICGIGELSQQVNFPKAGSYALTLNCIGCASKGQPGSGFRLYCDEQNASPMMQHDTRGNSDSFAIGGWGRNNGFKEEWGSAVFTIDKPGMHTIRFVGTTKDDLKPGYTVLDNIRIASADSFMESGFGGGSALGQPVEKEWGKNQAKDSRFSISLGLPRVSYETGWSVGGDFYQKPIQNWCKLIDPRAGKLNDQAINIWKKTGGYMPVWGVYTYFIEEDVEHGEDYPIMKSFIQSSRQLPPDPDNGVTLPAELTDKNCVEWGGKDLKEAGRFLSWTIICPETAVYKVTIETAVGGKYNVDFDGQSLGPVEEGGTPVSYLVKTTKGIHGVLIRSKEGTVMLQKITVSENSK